jgi:tetratricopeptide (TPR) repeat protein
LIKSYVAQGDDTAAEAAVDKLLTNFNDNPLIARAVWDTGQYYRDLKKYEKANRLYKHVVEHWPKAEHALWAQADLIKSYLALGDDPNAQAAVDKLLTNFNDNPLIARAIHDTAWEYRKLANYGRANELDRYVIDRWPEDVQAMWAKMDMAKTDIVLGNYAGADKTVDILMTDFSDQPEVATAIFMLGEQYYNKAFQFENESREAEAKEHFRKAIAIWERIINELPRSSMTPQAYYFAARCYETLGEYDYAANYYQMVIDKWPDYQYSDYAHFLLARCFEKLANSGSIPKNEAAVMIRHTCEKLLADYPNSQIVKATNNLLEQWESIKAQ